MPQRFDEAELLALIEDELDAADAERLRQRLVSEPEALALIERMREDRARLRATPEPEVPGGLLAELEPILARPMLMLETPARRRRRPVVSAVAAGVALATLGGFWAVLVSNLEPAAPEPVELVEAQRSPAPAPRTGLEAVRQPAPATDETWPPAGTVIHHRGPLVAVSGRPAVAREPVQAARTARGGEPSLVAADFMLVVRAGDATEAEQTLQRIVSDLGAETALVRNFTYREADELEEARRLAEGARSADPAEADDMVADALGETPARRQADRSAPGRTRPRPRPQDLPESRYSTSELLVGSKEFAPSFERQLDFSQRGAAYTLSVPAARLMQVLSRLQLDAPHQTALCIEAGGVDAETTDELRWLRDWPMAKQAADALDTHGRDAVILLPVVVEESH
ncbi:MAG: anti-sigma factor family protein [Planctomycetota bacterium]|jgi:hypothetical protein